MHAHLLSRSAASLFFFKKAGLGVAMALKSAPGKGTEEARGRKRGEGSSYLAMLMGSPQEQWGRSKDGGDQCREQWLIQVALPWPGPQSPLPPKGQGQPPRSATSPHACGLPPISLSQLSFLIRAAGFQAPGGEVGEAVPFVTSFCEAACTLMAA